MSSSPTTRCCSTNCGTGSSEDTANPWAAVCEASERVFRHFAHDPEVARRRYQIVRQVPALREREIVTVFRYERLFDEYLRALAARDSTRSMPWASPRS